MDIGVFLKALWPYLAVLYALDCILVVRGGHLLLTGTPLFGFRIREAGLRFAGILPWNWSVLPIREPLILSEAGLYLRFVPFPDDPRPPGPDDLEFIPWEQVREVKRDGRKVVVDGKVVHTAPTAVAAGLLAVKIKTVQNAPADYRSRSVEAILNGANDLRTIRETIRITGQTTALLMYASTFLFLLVFLLIPLSLLAWVPLSWIWFESAAVIVLCLITIFLWWRAHRVLLPGEHGDRIEDLLVMAVFPVSLPHAFGKLTRRLLTSFDAVALAVALAPDRAGGLLKREYTWTRSAAALGIGGDLAKMWKMRIEVLEKLAREAGLDPLRTGEILPTDKGGTGPTCPLCSASYREGVDECADCRVPLTRAEPLRRRVNVASTKHKNGSKPFESLQQLEKAAK